MIFMVCLRICIVALLLLGAAQAQRFTTPEDTARADALLKQMTTQEKIGQLNLPFYLKLPIPGVKVDPVSFEERVRRGDVGAFLFLTDYKEINRLQKIAMTETRLHIPLLFGFDIIHGFDTEFPVPLATAASWDPAQAEQAQAIAAEEAGHAGLRWSFAPMLDVARDPRWGRISEGAGEDPYVTGEFARAKVRGFQGDKLSADSAVAATAKHFCAYGAALAGLDYASVDVSERTLREIYLPPFTAAIAAGTAAVMPAFIDLAGVPMTANAPLLQGWLRGELGF